MSSSHVCCPQYQLCFLLDAFVRNNIQYGSYKYISNDIKKHYLKVRVHEHVVVYLNVWYTLLVRDMVRRNYT